MTKPRLHLRSGFVTTGAGPYSHLITFDETTRTARLTYRQPDGGSREVRLELPTEGIQEWLDSVSMEDDVQALWGPGVSHVEGAARLASIHLQERVATTREDPLVIRYGVAR